MARKIYPLEKYHIKVVGSSNDPCVYCQRPATTIDHIVPMAKGGERNDIQNWAPMCRKCNNNKGCDSVLMAFFNPQLKRRLNILNSERRNKQKKAAHQAQVQREWLAQQQENADVA